MFGPASEHCEAPMRVQRKRHGHASALPAREKALASSKHTHNQFKGAEVRAAGKRACRQQLVRAPDEIKHGQAETGDDQLLSIG